MLREISQRTAVTAAGAAARAAADNASSSSSSSSITACRRFHSLSAGRSGVRRDFVQF